MDSRETFQTRGEMFRSVQLEIDFILQDGLLMWNKETFTGDFSFWEERLKTLNGPLRTV